MPKSDAARITCIEEVTPGTTPATPALRALRLLSESLGDEQTSIASAELSSARGVTDEILGGTRVGGSLESYFVANADFDQWLAGLLGGTWTADVLVPGFTKRTWTIEKSVPLATSGPIYKHLRYKGVGIGQFGLVAEPLQPLKATWGFVGGAKTVDALIVTGATYPPASPTPENAYPMRSAELGFTWGGNWSDIATATTCHTRASLTLNPNAAVRECLGQVSANEWEPGRLVGTLSVTLLHTLPVFFMHQWQQEGLEGDVTLTLADQNLTPNHHTYSIALPRTKIRSIATPTPESSQDIVTEIEFAILQPTGGNAISITRATT